MKKKITTMLSVFALSSALLMACSGNSTESTTVADSTSAAESTVAAAESTTAVSESSVSEEPTAVAKTKVYVDAAWVKALIDGKLPESADYKIIEVAWGEESVDEAFLKAHIKGAHHLNTDDLEEEENWNIRKPEEITELLKNYGITKDTTVVCYSDTGVNSADDRAAFMFLWAGVENVKCLDGGFEMWTKAGYETESGSNPPVATDKEFGVTVPAHPEYIMSIDDVKAKLGKDENFKLVSIRAKDEFLGKTSGYSYIDRAGEPKGAIWGHDTDDGSYLNAQGTTVGLDKLEEYLSESGVNMDNELAFYCGTGWRAAVPFLIAYENGHITKMYDGGWFLWQKDPSLEVQLGDPQSSDVVYTTVSELGTDKAKK